VVLVVQSAGCKRVKQALLPEPAPNHRWLYFSTLEIYSDGPMAQELTDRDALGHRQNVWPDGDSTTAYG